MELELKCAQLGAYETGGELTLTQEETAETIVPDYCPDIARIIETKGSVFLHGREVRDGKLELNGTVRVTVLYTPEGEGGIRTLDFALPFRMESDHRALAACESVIAAVEKELLEARMLNPRKIFTRCKLCAHVTAYRKAQMSFCTDVESDPQYCMEKKHEQQQVTLLKQITEKDFTFTDEMILSAGREGAAELLSNEVRCALSEVKIVGSKLVFKGMLLVGVLYRTGEGKCCFTTGELPFSQIMEIEECGENAEVSIQLQITGTDIQIDGDDPEGRQLAVTVYLRAVACLRETQQMRLLTDLYSTSHDLTCEVVPQVLTEFCETLNRHQTVREVLEIGVAAESLLSASAHCGAVSVSHEGENTVLRTTAVVNVLYLDEGGVPLTVERGIEVACQAELPVDCKVRAFADCTEEVQGSIGARGIEVRFPVFFRIEAEKQARRVCISGVKLDTETTRDFSGAPSLVLRTLGRQETAWDIAKKYNTTIAAILAANQLTEEPLPHDKLLLIPRKRG